MSAQVECWKLGVIASWYLRPDQLPIYELLLKNKNPFVECARRYGKTTSILCFVLEQLIQNKNWICRWCEPDKNQAREIVIDEVNKIQVGIPEHLKFKWIVTDSYFQHPISRSRLYLRGVNKDRGDSARGPTAHIIVADEFGTWRDPDYVVTSALRPQLQTTNGPFIFASTPPEDLGHAYYDHKAWAIQDNRFIQRVIYDNASLTPERINELKAECRGEHTPAWQREYLCKPVTDPGRLVIPEYDETIHDVPDDLPKPPFFDTYVGMDLGLNDCTAGLFAYVDFVTRTLIIEGEDVANGRNTLQIVQAARAQEEDLWGTKPCQCELPMAFQGPKICGTHGIQPFMRWADNELQQLHDMATQHGYIVSPTRKDDKLSAINELRLLFTEGRIKIKKRCENLRFQLKVGLWNERKTDFHRGEKIGHLDAIDALIYLSRNVNWTHNPFPRFAKGMSPYTHFMPEPDSGIAKDVKDAFEPFSGGFG